MKDLKKHLDAIATHHQQLGDKVTRASGMNSGIDIYVVSDPQWKRLFGKLFEEACFQAEADHQRKKASHEPST